MPGRLSAGHRPPAAERGGPRRGAAPGALRPAQRCPRCCPVTCWPGVLPRWAPSPRAGPRRRQPPDCRGRRSPHQPDQGLRWHRPVYLRKGDLHQALPWLERGLDVCQVGDFPLLFHLVSSTLGYAYVLAGRVSEALPLLEQSVATEATGDDGRWQGPCLAGRGVSAPRPPRRGAGTCASVAWSSPARTSNGVIRRGPCGSSATSQRTASPRRPSRPKPIP